MKALVTGGAGFIGSNLVRELLRQRHAVTVLDNLLSGYRGNLVDHRDLHFIEGDIRDAPVTTAAVEGVDVLFHLAASVGNKRSIDSPVEDAEINVIGTLRVLEAARRARVRKFVLSSSAGIFGQLRTLPIREDHAIDPDSPYGASKLCAEKEALAYGKLYDIEVVCLRYFNVYGPNQRYDAYGNVIPIFTFQLLRGDSLTVFGDGTQTRDFVNVRDVVQANLRAAMTPGARGAFNIGSGTQISINQLIALLATATKLDAKILYDRPRKGDVHDSIADISAAHAAFGFEPSVRLDDGILEYVDWARSLANV